MRNLTRPLSLLLRGVSLSLVVLATTGFTPTNNATPPISMCKSPNPCTQNEASWDDETSWVPWSGYRNTGVAPGRAVAGNAPVAGFGQYRVVLAGSGGTVTKIGGPSFAITPGMSVVVLNGDVYVSGTLSGNKRLTVVASNRSTGADAGRAADIHLLGPSVGTTAANGRALGLVAQGNIIFELPDVAGGAGTNLAAGSGFSCLTSVNAALFAETGRITIPAEYTGEMPWRFRHDWTSTNGVVTPPPLCAGLLTIRGSITSHNGPRLTWEWGDGTRAGYSARTYLWDPELHQTVPPFFPLSDDWKTEGWRNTNEDCLTTRTSEVDCS